MADLTELRVFAKPQAIGPDTNNWKTKKFAFFIMMMPVNCNLLQFSCNALLVASLRKIDRYPLRVLIMARLIATKLVYGCNLAGWHPDTSARLAWRREHGLCSL